MIKYTTCPRCGNYPVKMTGTREDGYNYPGLEWSGQCDKCGYPDYEEKAGEEQAEDEHFATYFGRV